MKRELTEEEKNERIDKYYKQKLVKIKNYKQDIPTVDWHVQMEIKWRIFVIWLKFSEKITKFIAIFFFF